MGPLMPSRFPEPTARVLGTPRIWEAAAGCPVGGGEGALPGGFQPGWTAEAVQRRPGLGMGREGGEGGAPCSRHYRGGEGLAAEEGLEEEAKFPG